MTTQLTGIHHVTALAKSPQENLAFYTRVLGQRLVKKTVNFDDPFTYHLYYGDATGTPGTLLTHFPHPMAKRGVHGSPEIRETVMSIPDDSFGFWIDRLKAHHIECKPETTLDQDRVAFDDPDGMRIALVEAGRAPHRHGRAHGDIPAKHAITGIVGAIIQVPNAEETIDFLRNTLGFRALVCCGDRSCLHLGADRSNERLEIVERPADARTEMGAGSVHHVAWRVPDDAAQAAIAARIRDARVGVTPVIDRLYFRSIYFRIPGGVIFEIATDGPGFAVDEPADKLGRALRLPPQYESRRAEIERHLPPLETDMDGRR